MWRIEDKLLHPKCSQILDGLDGAIHFLNFILHAISLISSRPVTTVFMTLRRRDVIVTVGMAAVTSR
jgi:predicted dithiol-disulfide oxidoreductase (DUF899 family)